MVSEQAFLLCILQVKSWPSCCSSILLTFSSPLMFLFIQNRLQVVKGLHDVSRILHVAITVVRTKPRCRRIPEAEKKKPRFPKGKKEKLVADIKEELVNAWDPSILDDVEREEDYFDSKGNYVEYGNKNEIKDAWLESVEVDTRFADEHLAQPLQEKEDDPSLSFQEIAKIKRSIANSLQPRVKVLEALRRMKIFWINLVSSLSQQRKDVQSSRNGQSWPVLPLMVNYGRNHQDSVHEEVNSDDNDEYVKMFL
eukprot:Gb_34954 [translate_table: standard]